MNELITTDFIPKPTNLDDAWRIATILSESDLVPKDFKGKPANCLLAMQWGADIGLPGLQALQNIAIVNGRASIWGDAAKALVIGRSDCEDIKESFEGEGDNLTAVCIVKRKGKSPVTSRFSVTDARTAGLLNKQGPWTQYRNRMLQMRARSFALRDAFPDALRGLSIAEEAQDMGIEKEINPMPRDTATPKPTVATVDELLIAIKTMNPSDFKNVDPAPYSDDEKLLIRKAMTERRDQVKAERNTNVVADVQAKPTYDENTDWEKEIKQCGDTGTLKALLDAMPETEQITHGDLIDSQFDSFR